MTILMYRYGNICEPDIISTFRAFNVEVAEICEEITDKKLTVAKRVELVSDSINKCNPVFVFSINFFPAIAEVCHIYKVPYFCWTVDSPVLELFSKAIQYDTNRIFLFDKMQYEYFRRFNPECIYYLPLAAATERFDDVIQNVSKQDGYKQNADKWACDISFVGSLYSEKNKLSRIELPEYTRGFIAGIVESSLKVYGYNFVEEALTDECVMAVKVNASDFYEDKNSVINPDAYIVAHSYIGFKIAEEERIRTLNTLAQHFKVDLFTRSDVTPLRNVIVHGGVKTLTEMPLIFNRSRINLNMTIKPIQTGLPLRIFDIMGCGGFCMTNYQEEIADMFEIGQDIECYGSMEELIDKCAYYLEHEDVRARIARKGYDKVAEAHTYKMRIKELLRKGAM